MNLKNTLQEIALHYHKGGNILSLLRGADNTLQNSKEGILISYDFQAGSYIKVANEKIEYTNAYSSAIAHILNGLGSCHSLLEAGVGEATTLCHVAEKLQFKPRAYYGFDISWSRIFYAQKYARTNGLKNTNLFVGDMFAIPIATNAIDIVYTAHSIDANGGKEEDCIKELYRITNKYLVLFEQSYEFASPDAKKRMQDLGYACNIYKTVLKLGYKIIAHQLLGIAANPQNPTAVIVIEKLANKVSPFIMACPISGKELAKASDSFYCAHSMLAYPVIKGIPCLLPDNAIIATHFLD